MNTHEKYEQAVSDRAFYVKAHKHEMDNERIDFVKASALNLMKYLTEDEMDRLSVQERQEHCKFCHGPNNRINQLESVGSIPMIFCPVCGRAMDDE